MNANPEARSLCDRFVGCMLGLAVGDALGGCFEGQTPDWIARRYHSPLTLLHQPSHDDLYYTDDTQMALGVAEALVEDGTVLEQTLCRMFVSNYVAARGYGRGARRVLEAMEEGEDYRSIASSHFPGGSFGNGAAMRVAPVGLFFHEDHDHLWEQARLSALPTHVHPLGIEGAQLIALGVALALQMETFDRSAFFDALLERCSTSEFQGRIRQAATTHLPEDLPLLGNGIAAVDSVPTALACFSLAPTDPVQVIGNAILLGGDTDTIAAMAGALVGAFLGKAALPGRWLGGLEDHPESKGRFYLEALAHKLYVRWQRGRHGIE